MNMQLKLPTNLNLSVVLGWLNRAETALVGLALIGGVGYTAYLSEQAINVKADPVTPAKTISFDQTTLDSLRNLTVVNGTTPLGPLGKADPFGR